MAVEEEEVQMIMEPELMEAYLVVVVVVVRVMVVLVGTARVLLLGLIQIAFLQHQTQ